MNSRLQIIEPTISPEENKREIRRISEDTVNAYFRSFCSAVCSLKKNGLELSLSFIPFLQRSHQDVVVACNAAGIYSLEELQVVFKEDPKTVSALFGDNEDLLESVLSISNIEYDLIEPN